MEQNSALIQWHEYFRPWIAAISRRCASRLYGEEDIQQEGYIQLWRVWTDHAHRMSASEFIGLFKVSFSRHVANLMTRRDHKYPAPASLDTSIDLQIKSNSFETDDWYRAKVQELIERCDDPALKRWILKGVDGRQKGMNGMPKFILDKARSFAASL